VTHFLAQFVQVMRRMNASPTVKREWRCQWKIGKGWVCLAGVDQGPRRAGLVNPGAAALL
jgi:hypothetical protein